MCEQMHSMRAMFLLSWQVGDSGELWEGGSDHGERQGQVAE